MMTKDNYFIDDIEDLKEILSEITDINAPVNKNLATLLHLCCIMSCDTAPIEYLLEKGANPHIKDKFGLTAFDYAIRNPNQWARILNYKVKGLCLAVLLKFSVHCLNPNALAFLIFFHFYRLFLLQTLSQYVYSI